MSNLTFDDFDNPGNIPYWKDDILVGSSLSLAASYCFKACTGRRGSKDEERVFGYGFTGSLAQFKECVPSYEGEVPDDLEGLVLRTVERYYEGARQGDKEAIWRFEKIVANEIEKLEQPLSLDDLDFDND